MSHFGFFLFRSYGLSCPIAQCPNCGSPLSRRNVEKWIEKASFYPCHICWITIPLKEFRFRLGKKCPDCGEPMHKPEQGYEHQYECLNPKCAVISVRGERVKRDSRKLERVEKRV